MYLMDVVKTARNITDSVIVGFSGGKDSAVTLDLCFKTFSHVQPFFMYYVKGLEFQEKTLRYYEHRYQTEIWRIPHFELSELYNSGSFRVRDSRVPIIKPLDVYNYVRKKSGIYWIAAGERIADSIVRRAMIKHSGAIDKKRGRIYPVAYWNKAQIMAYAKINNLPISYESRYLGYSFGSLMGKDLIKIKEKFPSDFEKIKAAFPLVEAELKKMEFFNNGEN